MSQAFVTNVNEQEEAPLELPTMNFAPKAKPKEQKPSPEPAGSGEEPMPLPRTTWEE